MSISDSTEANILKLVFNATAWANYADNAAVSPQTTIDVALHTADPTDAGTMSSSETTYTSYARATVPRTTATPGWAVTGTNPTVASPTQAITFPTGTGGSGTVTHFSTGKAGGGAQPILWSGTVTPQIVVGTGVTPSLTGSTVCSLD